MKAWIAFVFGTLIFCFHWTMVAFHVGPYTPISAKLEPIQNAYMNPLFTQTWTLFAPTPPVVSLSLAYQCQLKNQDWSEIKEPANAILSQHYKYRVTYHGKLLALVENLARQLNNERVQMIKAASCDTKSESPCLTQVFKQQTQTKDYLLAQRFVKDLCTAEFGGFTAEKIYVVSRPVTPFSKRATEQSRAELIRYTY